MTDPDEHPISRPLLRMVPVQPPLRTTYHTYTTHDSKIYQDCKRRTGNTLRADFVGTQYKHSTVQSKPRAMDTHRGCSWCLSNGVGPRDSNRRCILCTSSVPARPRLLISDIYAGCLHIGPVSVRVPDRRIPCNRPRVAAGKSMGVV